MLCLRGPKAQTHLSLPLGGLFPLPVYLHVPHQMLLLQKLIGNNLIIMDIMYFNPVQ